MMSPQVVMRWPAERVSSPIEKWPNSRMPIPAEKAQRRAAEPPHDQLTHNVSDQDDGSQLQHQK
jgi:hypothetical protein